MIRGDRSTGRKRGRADRVMRTVRAVAMLAAMALLAVSCSSSPGDHQSSSLKSSSSVVASLTGIWDVGVVHNDGRTPATQFALPWKIIDKSLKQVVSHTFTVSPSRRRTGAKGENVVAA